PPGGRQDRDGDLSQSHRPSQSPAGAHRLPPLPEAQQGPACPQRKDLWTPPGRATTGRLNGAEKKNAAAIHEEVAREVNRFLGLVFAQRHKDGRTDLEAVESALRAALHQAGAATLAELLKFEAP